MITYEKFKDIIVKYINFYKCEDQLRRMNIEIFDSPIFETTGYYFDWLWEAYFTEDGCDTISWWAFEYHSLEEDFDNNGEYIGGKMEPGMWDKDDNVIPMVTIEDLWNEVKDQRLKREGEEDEIKDFVKDMVELQLKSAAEPVDMNVLKEALEDEWDNIIKFFGKPESLVCVDNTDEGIAHIMATYTKDKAPYKTFECETCKASVYLDSKVGVLLVLAANNYELYVWQG